MSGSVALDMVARARLADGAFYAGDSRDVYAALRQGAPLYRDPSRGLWGAMTYELVEFVSTHPAIFSSAKGSRPFYGQVNHMIDMDNPAHVQRRSLVSMGFTPRRIAEHEPKVRRLCDDILDTICERGSADLVREVAAQLPLIVIADMLGIPPEDRSIVLQWSEDLVGPELPEGEMITRGADALASYHEYASRLVAERRRAPGDDLISILVNAEIDGQRLSDDDVIGETLLILIGGDETTRHVIAGGFEQLLRHREHWDTLMVRRDGIRVAVEEMLRWVSPVKNMNRTLTRDYELSGQQLSEGDQLLLMYESANFDERHFHDPETFRPDREPNDHVAFGVGAHFCLGSSLARLELRVLLDRVFDRMPDLQLASDEILSRRRNFFISGIDHMPVSFTPSTPRGDGRLVLA